MDEVFSFVLFHLHIHIPRSDSASCIHPSAVKICPSCSVESESYLLPAPAHRRPVTSRVYWSKPCRRSTQQQQQFLPAGNCYSAHNWQTTGLVRIARTQPRRHGSVPKVARTLQARLHPLRRILGANPTSP